MRVEPETVPAPPTDAGLPPNTNKVLSCSETGDDPGNLSAEKVLHALRRRWWVALPLAIGVALAAWWLVSTRVPPVYTARTLIHVPAERPTVLYPDIEGRTDPTNFQKTQIATVKSRRVLEPAARELATKNLALFRNEPDIATWLESQLTADYTVAPEILQIKLKAADPDEMVIVLNTVRDVYVNQVLNKDRSNHAAHLKQLRDLSLTNTEDVKAKREELTVRAKQLGARDLISLRLMVEQGNIRLQALKAELGYLNSVVKREEVNQTAAPMEPVPDPLAVDEVLAALVAADETIAVHQKKLAELEANLLDYQQRLRNFESTNTYKNLVADIAAVKEAIGVRKKEHQTAAQQKVQLVARQRQKQDMTARQQTLVAMREYLAQLDNEIVTREKAASAVAQAQTELDALQKEILQEEERGKLIAARIRALEVEEQAPPRARVLEPAAITDSPQWQRYAKMGVVPFLGALSIFALIGWLDLRSGRINRSTDLDATRLTVLGTVPTVRPKVLSTFEPPVTFGLRTEFRELADAVDMAREMIIPNLPASGGFVLMVSSARAGEGKTILAGHLAVRLARTGRRTLVIDADTRNPRLHSLFDVDGHPGLGELLRGDAKLAEVVRPGPVPLLDVLPVGRSGPDTLSGLLAEHVPSLLTALRAHYDVIILDTAPVLVAAETLVLGRAADGVLLSVMRDLSRVPQVLACADRLAAARARVLGVIVNGERSARYGKY